MRSGNSFAVGGALLQFISIARVLFISSRTDAFIYIQFIEKLLKSKRNYNRFIFCQGSVQLSHLLITFFNCWYLWRLHIASLWSVVSVEPTLLPYVPVVRLHHQSIAVKSVDAKRNYLRRWRYLTFSDASVWRLCRSESTLLSRILYDEMPFWWCRVSNCSSFSFAAICVFYVSLLYHFRMSTHIGEMGLVVFLQRSLLYQCKCNLFFQFVKLSLKCALDL